MRTVTHALVTAAIFVSAGCVKQTAIPPIAGPSELSMSLRLAATPDTLPQDGASQSAIVMQALDAAGQAKSGVAIRLSVNGLGTLSTGTVVTGSDGKATAVFTAPAPGASTTIATVLATPAGSDAVTAAPFQVNIKLTQVGAIPPVPTVPSSAAPTVEFQFSPTSPVVGQSIFFNASQTIAAAGHYVTLYSWDFGDGTTDSTTGQFPTHVYSIAGTYNVLLTVTDDVGAKQTKVHTLVVGAGLPVAILVINKTGGMSIFADGSGSTAAANATIASYRFIWGDNTADGVGSAAATHTYVAPAGSAFVVTLRVTDSVGRVGTASASITVP